MKLKDKILMFSASVTTVLVVALVVFSALGFRWFAIQQTESHVRSLAETVKVGLTESMIHDTIDKRQQFLARLAKISGVRQVRVVRGPAVIAQFGPGFPAENVRSESIEQVLATGKEVFETLEVDGEVTVRGVVPYTADDQGIPDCLNQCHKVNFGTVLGAVSVDISLAEVRRQGIIGVGVVGLAVLLAAMLVLALLRRMMNPLTESARAVQEVTSQAIRGSFSGRISQRSR